MTQLLPVTLVVSLAGFYVFPFGKSNIFSTGFAAILFLFLYLSRLKDSPRARAVSAGSLLLANLIAITAFLNGQGWAAESIDYSPPLIVLQVCAFV